VVIRTPTDGDYARLLAFRTELRRFQRWSEECAQDAGLTGAQHQLLLAVRGHSNPAGPTVGDLAELLLVRHHTAVGLIDRTQALGLVVRKADLNDHRVVRLALTATGESSLHALSAAHLQELDRVGPLLGSLSLRPS
jgi:DNA-binding MarR family transcriptional regulator